MGDLYDPVLTGCGLMNPDNVTLTQKARDTFIAEVGALLTTGNPNGKGQLNALGQLIPIPPIPGPSILNITTLKSEPLFWFEPDPFAPLMIETIKDPKKVPMYYAIFLDLLFEKTAAALNAPGNTLLFPVIDWSFGIPNLSFPPTLPDIQLALKIPTLTLPQLALKFGITFPPPIPPIPKIPIPPLPPKLPSISLPIPPLILLDFCIGLIKIPFDLLLQLAIPSPDLVINLPKLPEIVFNLAFDIMFKLMVSLDLVLITPKLLVASLLVYLKNVVGMVCTDLIGIIFGANGALTKGAASLTGLV